MAISSRLYNTLPSLSEANERFRNRDEIFDRLLDLLSRHQGLFDVCLIHAHCTLADGEVMLENGDVSMPVKISGTEHCYPVSWLPSGEPYEYTTKPTKIPPPSLFDEFRALTRDVKVLGLHHNSPGMTETRIEWTEGRNNCTRRLTEEDRDIQTVETQWSLTKEFKKKPQVQCVLYCHTTTTRHGAIHLGKTSHQKVSS
ncbi:hypothetical protein F4803DRAFT_511859 [Xylaria telfairii]|nr:hypothetical protein F4803DRAFT_511859 [Xylaria telfairii]